MPTNQTDTNSTPDSGTGSGGLRGAAGAIAGMLSEDFTIADKGQDGEGGRNTQQQAQRREPREGQRQAATQHDANEPVVREDVEEVDDEGNVVFRPHAEVDETDEHLGDDPEGQKEPKDGELKDDAKIAVPVGDGKTEDVTLGELKKGYLRQADYTRKTQTLVTERNDFQATRDAVNAERTSLAASIETVGRFVKELLPQEPTQQEWDNLRQSNPAVYAATREEWRSFKEKLGGIESAFRNAQNGQSAEMQRVLKETASKEKVKLETALPEWTDARVKKRDIADIFDAASKLGFTADDVKNTVDHRLMLMCLKAAKYDRLMSAKKNLNTTQRGKSSQAAPTKVLEPGTRGQMPTRKTAVVGARDSHHKTQSIRSGAALIEKLL